MPNSKGFNKVWYQSRLIFGLILVGLSILTLFLSNPANNLLLILGLAAGSIIGVVLALYYKNNLQLQKELSVRQKIFAVSAFLIVIFLNRSVFSGSDLNGIFQMTIFVTSFFGSMVGLWGLIGKR